MANLSKKSEIVHITDQEQAGLVPKSGTSVVTVHDLFHLYPSIRDGVKVGEQNPSFIRKSDLKKIKRGLARASLLICVSKDTQQECEMRFPGTPTTWIPHAINLEEYQKNTQRPSWFNKGVNLLVIGSEEPRKGSTSLWKYVQKLTLHCTKSVLNHQQNQKRIMFLC